MRTRPSLKTIYHRNQELFMNVLVAFFCLVLSATFPTDNYVQKITSSLFFLVLLPIAYIKLILNKNLSAFGLTLPCKPQQLIWTAGIFLANIFLFFLLLNYSDFPKNYSLKDYITTDFRFFLVYELLFVNILLFISEFFYRGFILSIFRERFDEWSIGIQSSIYLLILYLGGGLNITTAPLAILSVTGGVLAYRTKSFVYSYFANISAIIFLDAYYIHLISR
jgi:hypothetical protein